MSIALMTLAFKSALPTTPKFVLIALCDSANDQGECYPSVSALMAKCSLSDRGVQQALARLEECGYLRREYRNGRSTTYWIGPSFPDAPERRAAPPKVVHPRTMFTPNDVHPTPERGSPPPPNDVHPTPERGSPITVIEPSVEPSGKQKKRASAPEVGLVQLLTDGLTEETAHAWLTHRKAKKAPLTELAWRGFKAEADKAGWTRENAVLKAIHRNWTSVEADWLTKTATQQQPTGETAYQRNQRERVHEMTGGLVSAKPPGSKQTTTMEIFDVTARVLG